MKRFLLSMAWLISSLLAAPAGETPSVSFIYPAGASAGSTNPVTLAGVDKTWPVQAWTQSTGITFTALEKAGQMEVRIAPDAPPGPVLVHFFNSNGVSKAKQFVVGHLRESMETEDNDAVRLAQPLPKLPVTVNGKLNKNGDVDSFAMELGAGQWLVAEVQAYRLDSPVDAVLHLKDQAGSTLAFNHDGLGLDPLLAHPVPTNGTYILQLAAFAYPPQANVQFTGGDNCIYRLTLTTGPYIRHTLPAAVQWDTQTSLRLHGWNLSETNDPPPLIKLDARDASGAFAELPEIQTDNSWTLPVRSCPQILEQEPNNTLSNAAPVRLPCGLHGTINPAGDRDCFSFEAAKNDILTFNLISSDKGFPLDAVLEVFDESGKSLQKSDDSGKRLDPQLTWTAPLDGVYLLCVSDLYHHGGSQFFYELEMGLGRPGFDLSFQETSLILEAGKTAEVKGILRRFHGHTNEIRIGAVDLPEGIRMEQPEIPSKTGAVTLKLSATQDAPFSQTRIRFYAECTASDDPGLDLVRRFAKIMMKGQYAETGDLLVNEANDLWLTVVRPQK